MPGIDPSMLMASGQSAQSNATDVFNAFSTLGTNLQSQIWSKEMYKRQRADALEFWGMQNDYNSPKAQVARLKEAGLNPAFAYGGSNSGGNIQVPDVSPVNFREPKLQGPSRLDPLMYADLRIKNAQANNLETQTAVIREEAAYKKFLAKRTELDYNLENDLFSTNADARRENLRKTRLENEVLVNRDMREAVQTASNVTEAAHRVLTMIEQRKGMPLDRARTIADTHRIRTEIENMKRTGVLQQLDIDLRKVGVNPNDPLWSRYVGRFLQDVGDGKVTAESAGKGLMDWILRTAVYDYPDFLNRK